MAESLGETARPVRVAVVGATGYGGAELLRHLLVHPHVRVTRLVAKDNLGKRLGDVHLSLAPFESPGAGSAAHLRFEDAEPTDVAKDADLVCVGLPHKVSAPVVDAYCRLGVAVVDLAGDYRLRDRAAYERYYEAVHPHPERLGTFAYGLPELYRDAIARSRHVASPGCFATAIAMALYPVARKGLLAGRVHVTAMTGSSGSGANPAAGTHHPLRAQTLRSYKPLQHQHVPEIEQTLTDQGAKDLTLDFVPVSAPLVRGILTTCYADVDAGLTDADLQAAVAEAWQGEPLVRVCKGRLPEVNAVAGSMYVEVAATWGEIARNGRRTVVMHSAIDNLVKGGAGQAVQSINLMLGCDELLGLRAPAQWP